MAGIGPIASVDASDMRGTKAEVALASVTSRVPGDAKILKGSEVNPFKSGSGSWERTERVLKNVGKTREQIEKLSDVLATTIRNLLKLGIIKIVAFNLKDDFHIGGGATFGSAGSLLSPLQPGRLVGKVRV
ncbi:hypothetical protein IVA80_10415 [Bradyrhizobium sp. 139]|uniref:hypothetical protein n=1 Tax=Bradyrhizobium sp. 139 TaxID=2782616 RepID=UPI001FFB3DBA|nr:hypothetical protein [Bradyrhizobium sp. 139]MCK1741270.1 hypothetical protein [Bradyrhizobium sp. 139]